MARYVPSERHMQLRQRYLQQQRSPLNVGVLWLFLGFCGFHRIYLGHPLRGLGFFFAAFFLIVTTFCARALPHDMYVGPGPTLLGVWWGLHLMLLVADLPFALRSADAYNVGVVDHVRTAHYRAMEAERAQAAAYAAWQREAAEAQRRADEARRQADVERRHRAAWQAQAVIAARTAPPVERHVVERHTVERQVVVVRCKRCANLTPVDAATCRHCGAPSFY